MENKIMELNFSIKNQILERCDNQVIVNKSKGYVECNFTFLTPEWRGLDKFAIFKNEKGEAYTHHLGTGCECSVVPIEEVQNGDFFKVSIYGGDRITTSELSIVLIRSGYTTDISVPGEHESDIFEEIFNALNGKVDDADLVEDTLELYSNGDVVASVKIITDDLLATIVGELDLSDYVQKSSTSGLLRNDGTVDTTSYSTFSLY